MKSCALLLAFACVACDAWTVGSSVVRAPISQSLSTSRPWVQPTSTCRAPSPVIQRKPKPSKNDVLELEGVVLEALPSATFRVQLDDTEQVLRPRRLSILVLARAAAEPLQQFSRLHLPHCTTAGDPRSRLRQDSQELHQDSGRRSCHVLNLPVRLNQGPYHIPAPMSRMHTLLSRTIH